jgi:hypothetical protein
MPPQGVDDADNSSERWYDYQWPLGIKDSEVTKEGEVQQGKANEEIPLFRSHSLPTVDERSHRVKQSSKDQTRDQHNTLQTHNSAS